MSKDAELKRKLCSMLGTSVLAVSLSSAPASFDPANFTIDAPHAHAKSGEGGNSGSGSGESGEGGNSGSGSGNSGEGGSSGSGSGNSGEGGNSGSGSGNSGEGGNSGSGSGNSGEGGNSGSGSGNSGRGSGNSGKGKGGYSNRKSIPARFGHVVNSSRSFWGMEVRYSDGWSESIRGGRYSLKNPRRRTVISRRAKNTDYRRLRRAIK